MPAVDDGAARLGAQLRGGDRRRARGDVPGATRGIRAGARGIHRLGARHLRHRVPEDPACGGATSAEGWPRCSSRSICWSSRHSSSLLRPWRRWPPWDRIRPSFWRSCGSPRRSTCRAARLSRCRADSPPRARPSHSSWCRGIWRSMCWCAPAGPISARPIGIAHTPGCDQSNRCGDRKYRLRAVAPPGGSAHRVGLVFPAVAFGGRRRIHSAQQERQRDTEQCARQVRLVGDPRLARKHAPDHAAVEEEHRQRRARWRAAPIAAPRSRRRRTGCRW